MAERLRVDILSLSLALKALLVGGHAIAMVKVIASLALLAAMLAEAPGGSWQPGE